jgi:hypothetical protein
MAVQTPPYVVSAGSHPAALFRQAIAAFVYPGRSGVLYGGSTGSEFEVTQATSPAMSVQVAPGRALLQGGDVSPPAGYLWSAQGHYFALNDASVTLTVAAADLTNPRIDVVYLQVRDAFYSGSSNDARLGIVTGTPASTPTVPALPSVDSMALAYVAVAANAASIINANISDQRVDMITVSQKVARVYVADDDPSVSDDGPFVWFQTNVDGDPNLLKLYVEDGV